MEMRAILFAMSRSKAGPLLVAGQVALALAVAANLTYIVQQRLTEITRPTGIDLANSFWVSTEASEADYDYLPGVKSDLAYLNALPGVIAAGVISTLPQTFSGMDLQLDASPHTSSPNEAHAKPGEGVAATIYMGSEKIIDALGLKLVAGRRFDASAVMPPAGDLMTAVGNWAPEIIVTRKMASELFPHGQALGRTVWARNINKPAVIVGIVDPLRANPKPPEWEKYATQVVILPIIPPGPDTVLVVRTRQGQRDAVMARVEKEFSGLQAGRFMSRMEAYDKTASVAREEFRSSVLILGAVTCCVLAVTGVGWVGQATFNVAKRTKELGTRRALGARRLHILRYFLLENWITTTVGVGVGAILAIAAGVQISHMYQLPRLPLYYVVGGIVVLWMGGLLAVLVPALRAAAVSPAEATRTL